MFYFVTFLFKFLVFSPDFSYFHPLIHFRRKYTFSITLIFLSLIPFGAYARTLTVSQDGSGNYISIAKALAAAQPGDVIQVAAGTYTQGLTFSRNNIRIEGEGYQKTRVVVKDDFAIKIQNVTGCQIQGLFLYAQGKSGYSAVLIDNSKVVLRHCLVTSDPSGYGVSCFNKSTLNLDHNTLVNNGKGGAVVFDGSSKVKLKNNVMVGNAIAINYKGTGECPAEVTNNNLWSNTKDYIGCTHVTNNFSENPQFVDPKAGNYHLGTDSSLIKKATDGQDMGASTDTEVIKLAKNDPDFLTPVKSSVSSIKPKPAASTTKRSSTPNNTPPRKPPKTDDAEKLNASTLEPQSEAEGSPNEKTGDEFEIADSSEKEPAETNIHMPEKDEWETDDAKPRLQQKEGDSPKETVADADDSSKETAADEMKTDEPPQEEPGDESVKKPAKIDTPSPAEGEISSAPQKPALGVIALDTDPSQAQVYIGGEDKGTTPLTLSLPSGKYSLEFRKDKYGAQLALELAPGDNPAQKITLPQKASLLVSSSREAQVYLDATQYGNTPLTVNFLSPGKHELKLTGSDKESAFIYRATIELNSGDNTIQADKFERIAAPAQMSPVPAGEFEMGSGHGEKNEGPEHKVFVDNFYIDIYEVTNQQYRQYLQAKGLNLPDQTKFPEFSDPAQPVSGITWEDAQGYCQWAGKRLPTEAEWEKAARGTDCRIYPWGNDFAKDKASVITNMKYPQPPGSYPKGVSPYGVQDMAGNVWEWCSDWYQADYYAQSLAANPKGPDTGGYKVLRGGAFDSPAYDVRTTRRWRYEPDLRRCYIGFRCVWQP